MANVLTESARTMRVEVDVPNETGALRAGLYAEVTFHVPRSITPSAPSMTW